MLFTSIDKLHTIELTIFGDIAEISIITFHYESYKTFLLLLKKVIEYMADKDIKYVKQRILEEEVNLFSYSTIDSKYYDNDTKKQVVLITTPIVHIAEEIYNAMGLKKL